MIQLVIVSASSISPSISLTSHKDMISWLSPDNSSDFMHNYLWITSRHVLPSLNKVVMANNSSVSLISLVVTPLWPPHIAFSISYLALCFLAMTAGLDETVTTKIIVANENSSPKWVNTFTFSGACKPGTKELTFVQRLSQLDTVVTDSWVDRYLDEDRLNLNPLVSWRSSSGPMLGTRYREIWLTKQPIRKWMTIKPMST